MRKTGKRRLITLLLCLGIVATMSFGTAFSASADFEEDAVVNSIDVYALAENDYVSFDASSGLTLKRDGYYSFAVLCSTINTDSVVDTWWALPDDSTSTLTDKIESLGDYVASSSKHYKAGDKITREIWGSPVWMFYRASESDPFEVYCLDLETLPAEPHTGDVFSLSTTTESASEVIFSVSMLDIPDVRISDFNIYLDDELYASAADIGSDFSAGASFEFAVHTNGLYNFTATSSDGEFYTKTFEVNCIDTSIVTDETETSTAPNITYSLSTNETGLSGEEPLTITISSDIQCSITSDGMPAAIGVTSANFDVYENGVYTFYATNEETAETSSVTVTVTNFGDGTLPDYTDPDNIVDPTTQNDNPISDGNHGSYWEDAAANLTDENGNPLENLVEDGSGKNATNPSDSMSVLPQTGITSWVVALGCSLAAIGIGVFLMFRRGIFARLSRKGGDNNG